MQPCSHLIYGWRTRLTSSSPQIQSEALTIDGLQTANSGSSANEVATAVITYRPNDGDRTKAEKILKLQAKIESKRQKRDAEASSRPQKAYDAAVVPSTMASKPPAADRDHSSQPQQQPHTAAGVATLSQVSPSEPIRQMSQLPTMHSIFLRPMLPLVATDLPQAKSLEHHPNGSVTGLTVQLPESGQNATELACRLPYSLNHRIAPGSPASVQAVCTFGTGQQGALQSSLDTGNPVMGSATQQLLLSEVDAAGASTSWYFLDQWIQQQMHLVACSRTGSPADKTQADELRL